MEYKSQEFEVPLKTKVQRVKRQANHIQLETKKKKDKLKAPKTTKALNSLGIISKL